MFDLERAISDWRRHMLAAGLKAPAPLDELESHLLDLAPTRFTFSPPFSAGESMRRWWREICE
jgi:hypothetical protein